MNCLMKCLGCLRRLGWQNEMVDSEFFYVPSLDLEVARKTTLQGKNWYESHEELAKQGSRMLTIPEFVEVLKYTRDNEQEVYNDITQVRSPWRSEWIDAYFEERKDGMYVLTRNKANAEKLESHSDDKRISLDSWIENPTKQGLPSEDIKDGNLSYWSPVNGAVAWFIANVDRAFYCDNRYPSYRNPNLGVRDVRENSSKSVEGVSNPWDVDMPEIKDSRRNE